jgi:hypothetical protein
MALSGDREGMFYSETYRESSFPNIALEIAIREKEFYF